jgi:phosphoglycolate phosphatase-like HAD superfamily hydrolase
MKMKPALLSVLTVAFASICGVVAITQAADPLPSWNDGKAKQSIRAFVKKVTTPGSPSFVPPEERIATFDNDGTLWVEKPVYTQVVFAMDRVAAMAPKHPEWKKKEPFKAILARDRGAMEKLTLQDVEKIVAETHSGMTVEAFHAIIAGWLATAKDARFKRPYTELVYQPMLELMRYLRANGFTTYIATGGGQEFVRAFADPVYGIPPEQVIGSAGKVKYEYGKGRKPVLMKLPEVLLIDDKAGKPEGINLFIGRRPVAAFGNSTGDQQMLEYTQGGPGDRLMMLVHHDDGKREYAYGPESKVGTFSDALMAEARKRGWVVISMKNDWEKIFSWQKP